MCLCEQHASHHEEALGYLAERCFAHTMVVVSDLCNPPRSGRTKDPLPNISGPYLMHNASAAAAVLCLLTVIKVSLKNKVTLVDPFSSGKIKGMNVQLIEIVIQIILIHKNINCVQWNVIS